MMNVDDYGRVVTDVDHAVELMYSGGCLDEVFVAMCPDVELYNEMCEGRDKASWKLKTPPPIAESPESYHDRLSSEWLIAEGLKEIDIHEFLLSLCDTDTQRARVNEEMALYEAKGLAQLLKVMIVLVDHFRRNKIIWGVGRGSSVSSYVLYLIGVHKIDSLKYRLDIKEFLK